MLRTAIRHAQTESGSWSRIAAALVARDLFHTDGELRDAKALTEELESSIKHLADDMTTEPLEVAYLSPLIAGCSEPEPVHFTVVDVRNEEKHKAEPAPIKTQGPEPTDPAMQAASWKAPAVQLQPKLVPKPAPKRRRVIQLDEMPPSRKAPKLSSGAKPSDAKMSDAKPIDAKPGDAKPGDDGNGKRKWSLGDVFGDKLNLVDGDRRDVLNAFLDKRPRPAFGETNRIKIHEETTVDPATSKTVKTTLYVLLDWDKHSYKKTRKQKAYEKPPPATELSTAPPLAGKNDAAS
ncbi:hypothetical protein CTAYLR_010711 [Chrysophaeum taylorii]|uniref:Uncharacterized protein n=1 Tax=Chrysophaeum taylorii TaxID=2483200 RepID=A0AAD7UEV1_9STRA|nr:hypothetical protein CTAYLR_010711 [Chrysophaeum taylorii]